MNPMDDVSESVWAIAASRKLADKPELVVDLMHVRHNLWAGGSYPPNSEFARPLLLDWTRKDSTVAGLSFFGDLASLHPKVGIYLAPPVSAMLWRRAYLQEERADLGMKIWRENPTMVMEALRNLPAIQKAQELFLKGSAAETPDTFAARRSLENIRSLYATGGLPDPADPPALLAAMAGWKPGPGLVTDDELNAAVAAGVARAIEKSRGQPDRLGAEVRDALAELALDQDKIGAQMQGLYARMLAEAAEREHEAERVQRIQEVVGFGRLFGLVVGLGNPAAGAAITTVVEQGVVLAQVIGTGLKVASLATGLGAVVAIGGALGMLGKQGGDPTVDAITKTMKAYVDALADFVQKNIGLVRADLARWNESATVRFERLQDSVNRIADEQVRQGTANRHLQEQARAAAVADAMTRLASAPSASSVMNALITAYLAATEGATAEALTGQRSERRQNLTRELCDVVYRPAAGTQYRWTPQDGIPSPAIVAQFLEIYPTLLADACDVLRAERPSASASGAAVPASAVASGSAGLSDLPWKSLAWPPGDVHAHTAGLLVGAGSIRSDALHLGLMSHAFEQMVAVMRQAMLDPTLQPGADPRTTLPVAQMLGDVRRTLQWARVVTLVLGSPTVRKESGAIWTRAAESVLRALVDSRRASGVLKDMHAPAATALLAGATAFADAGGARVFDLSLSKAYATPAPSERPPHENTNPIDVADDRETIFDVLRIAAHLGRPASIESVASWTDQPHSPQQPAWQGAGSYHEVWAIVLDPDGHPEHKFVLAYLFAHDHRRGLTGKQLTVVSSSGEWSPIKETTVGAGRTDTFHPARGRPKWSISNPDVLGPTDGRAYCPGPYDDFVAVALQEALRALASPSGLESRYEKLRAHFAAQGIEIALHMGAMPEPGQVAQGMLMRALARAASSSLDEGLLLQAHRAWQCALTSAIASADQGGFLDDAVRHLVQCPRWLRDRDEHHALLKTPESQQAFGGAELLPLAGLQTPNNAQGGLVPVRAALHPHASCALLIGADGLSIRLVRQPVAQAPAAGPQADAPALNTAPVAPGRHQTDTVLPATNRAMQRFEQLMILVAQMDDAPLASDAG
jgi:hypothetical protein